jgi:hypothetical protein
MIAQHAVQRRQHRLALRRFGRGAVGCVKQRLQLVEGYVNALADTLGDATHRFVDQPRKPARLPCLFAAHRPQRSPHRLVYSLGHACDAERGVRREFGDGGCIGGAQVFKRSRLVGRCFGGGGWHGVWLVSALQRQDVAAVYPKPRRHRYKSHRAWPLKAIAAL